ncbi:hypothetical protein LRR18_07880 [Mangrovimonas sp. AS39]|uniref:M56 family metallopeptidase n=1 Tax=Mangrovimonas futianensis TaxID=2895523 RepID=UPI001E2BB879|nr:M56 family metallopeptidase [Mangrovimonas futianensis]MCF1191499.1 hypothetical protein [Mangrovimonas futianensis]MCF1195194.1 hypothetical protein [Mangrovimonas futianensis]
MEYFIKASSILTIFYLVYFLFLKQETFFQSNRLFLLTGIICAIILPNILIPIYVELEPQTINSNLPQGVLIEPTEITSKFNWLILIPYTYFTVTIVLLGKFLIEITSIFGLIKRGDVRDSEDFKMVETIDPISPFSFFKWIFYHPKQFHLSELKLIINHEKAHAKQYHSLDVLFMELTCIIFWFNPISWIYKKSLKQNLEFIADKETQKSSQCQKTYQRLLLKTSLKNHHMALANPFYNSLIKKRIVMLQKSKSSKIKAWKYILILPLLGGFLMSFNTKEVFLTKKTEPTSTNQITVRASSTTQELNKIEGMFTNKNLQFKFTDLTRNSNQLIETISISTKKFNDSKFTKRLTINKQDNAEGIASFNISKQGDGDDILFQLADNKRFTQSNPTVLLGERTIGMLKEVEKEEKTLGDSPLYIVNGKPLKTHQIPSKQFTVDSSITLMPKKEAIKTYGNQAKDGAIIFNGKVSFDQNKTITEIIITKDFTEADLVKVKNDFKKEGIEIKFKGIKRNKTGEIIAIKITAKGTNLSANYQISTSTPISPIVIQYNSDGNKISIGNWKQKEKGESIYVIRKPQDDMVEIKVDGIGESDMIFIGEDGEKQTVKVAGTTKFRKKDSQEIIEIKTDKDGKVSKHVWVTKSEGQPMIWSSDENVEIEIDSEKSGDFFFSSPSNANPLYLINGKEVSKEDVSKMDKEKIESIDVLKGEKAVETYGDKAKDGVISIKTK